MQKKRTLFLFLLGLLLVAILCACQSQVEENPNPPINQTKYRDLTDQWYEEDAILYGYPSIFAKDDLFQGDKIMTRMEFARLLHEALHVNVNYFAAVDIQDFFSDLTNDIEGSLNVYDLVVLGIWEAKGSFNKDGPVTREEMVHIIMNALKYRTGGDYPVILMLPIPFADDAEIGEMYRNDIMTAQLLQLILGRGNNYFYPKEAATRAEAVTIVSRLLALPIVAQPKFVIQAAVKEEFEGLTMQLHLQNHMGEEIKLHHNSGQTFDFQLFDQAGKLLYTWSRDKVFTMALTTTVLADGESLLWEAKLTSKEYDALPGKAAELKAFLIGTCENIKIDTAGYSAFLTP